MRGTQKVVCGILCLGMFGYLLIGFLLWTRQREKTETNYLACVLPLLEYCETNQRIFVEDEQTCEAIVKANQDYLEEQVIGENTTEEENREEENLEEEENREEEENQEEKEETREEEAPAEEETLAQEEPVQTVFLDQEKLQDYDYLISNFFIVDSTTATDSQQINAQTFMEKDLTLSSQEEGPEILIYHSHSQEEYADSLAGDSSTSVVGVGSELAGILQETYGYQVIHLTDTFDVVDGEIDRNRAYDYARARVEEILAENPSVEVVIDLHRDGVPDDRHLYTEIDGKPTAQIMFFNGLSYSAMNGEIQYLPNPWIEENLAFSFQLMLASKEYFPGLNRPIYLSSLRYNLHLKPRALLVEVGAQNNTVEEAKNAMAPLAWLLHYVLQ